MTDEEVDSMLKGCNPRKLSMIEKNEQLAAALEYFMGLKQSVDSRVEGITLTWFYNTKLRPKFGGPSKIDTVKKFIREVLLRDSSTGEWL